MAGMTNRGVLVLLDSLPQRNQVSSGYCSTDKMDFGEMVVLGGWTVRKWLTSVDGWTGSGDLTVVTGSTA